MTEILWNQKSITGRKIEKKNEHMETKQHATKNPMSSTMKLRLPWWSSCWESASSAGSVGSILGQGTKIPHATEQLRFWATTRESVCHTKVPHDAMKILHAATKTQHSQINKSKCIQIGLLNDIFMKLLTYHLHRKSSPTSLRALTKAQRK